MKKRQETQVKILELKVYYNFSDQLLSIAFEIPEEKIHKILKNRGVGK